MNSVKVLVAGASGVLGGNLAQNLLDSGYPVTVLVRKRSAAESFKASGASIIEADFSRPETLLNVCKDIDVVVVAIHAIMGRGGNQSNAVDYEGHKYFIQQAKNAGVKQFIYTSVYAASPAHPVDFFRTKYAIEQILQQSGIPYTIIRLAAFMEWHAWRLLGKDIMEKGKANILGKGENRMNFVAVRDIVSAINFMLLNDAYLNKVVNLGGPENLTRNQVATMFANALNKPLKTSHLPVGIMKALAPVIQWLHPGMARIFKLAIATEHSNETIPPDFTIAQFGLTPTFMKDFIDQELQKAGS